MPKETRWFLQPLNAFTNEVIASMIGSDPGSVLDKKNTTEEKVVQVWEVSYSDISMLERTKKTNSGWDLQFSIYASTGVSKRISPKPFLNDLKRKRSQEKKKAESFIRKTRKKKNKVQESFF